MDESFEIPVTYKGTDQFFTARLIASGYTHQFHVRVFNQEVIFERDEEQAYRAIISDEDAGKNIDRELLQAIAESIQEILR